MKPSGAPYENLTSDDMVKDKLAMITEFQKDGEPVCRAGDRINDAPALKTAQAGIAMGALEVISHL